MSEAALLKENIKSMQIRYVHPVLVHIYSTVGIMNLTTIKR